MNDDLAQCDVLGASWQAQHGACQGPEGLLCSLLQVSQMHLPGKIEQERLVSCLELSHQLCIAIFPFLSIWVQDYVQGRIIVKNSLLYNIQRQ